MTRRRRSLAPTEATRLLRDRAILILEAQDGPISSARLAREVLGLRHGSEAACEAILVPVLGEDPRLARDRQGRWVLGEPAPPSSPAVETPLRERAWAVWSVAPDGRAAAVVRFEGGRLVAEAAAPGASDDEGDEGDVETLSEPGRDRLAALARGALGVSWDAASLIRPWAAPSRDGTLDPADRALSTMESEGRQDSVFSLSAMARVGLGPPRPRSLDSLAAALGIRFVDADSPIARARLAAECLLGLLEREPLRELAEDGLRVRLEARGAPLPAVADPASRLVQDLASLPREPGVYRFYDRDGALLYVGKARDLHRRVGSYFQARERPDPRTAAWLGSVDSIEHERSGSELEALLREARQIASRAPAMNRQRAVHARRGRTAADLVLVQPAERPGAVRIALVKDGGLAAQLVLGPRGGGRERLRSLLASLYFFSGDGGAADSRNVPSSRPGPRTVRRGPPSRRAAGRTASRALLASWLRRQPPSVPPLDPTDDPGPEEAFRRILATAAALRRGETGVFYR